MLGLSWVFFDGIKFIFKICEEKQEWIWKSQQNMKNEKAVRQNAKKKKRWKRSECQAKTEEDDNNDGDEKIEVTTKMMKRRRWI